MDEACEDFAAGFSSWDEEARFPRDDFGGEAERFQEREYLGRKAGQFKAVRVHDHDLADGHVVGEV
jgi:hypothetical protein